MQTFQPFSVIRLFQPMQNRIARWQRSLIIFLSAFLLVLSSVTPAGASLMLAQFPGAGGGDTSSFTLGWVELAGLDVFQIAGPNSAISNRRQQVQDNLQEIRDDYLDLENPVANITTTRTEDGHPQVYVNGQYLLTVTQEDATLQGMTSDAVVQHLKEVIPETLERAYQHRQPEYRRRQFTRIGVVLALAILIMVVLSKLSDRLVRSAIHSLGASLNQDEVTEDQQHQIHDLRDRMLPLVQGFLLAGTLIWAMGLFPESRVLQQDLLSTLKVPIIIGIVIVVAYVGIRLTYALVDRIAVGLTDEDGFSSRYSRRARLRISTLSSVIKNIANFVWIGIGFLIALTVTGVDFALLLASVGIIGLAFSLAAQNLVKGAIRGFFIVLEDQFAIGDIVKIGDDAGLVEKLNLRITQLRDTGGRLITIPTSDITRVANYSLHWARADLKIPVHYKTDVNRMLRITREVADEMQSAPEWNNLILDEPQILGVDDFGDSALIIRVWIKTEPMKQWDVSREFRRRFKQTLQDSDTEVPFPQRDVWLHPSDEFRVTLQGSLEERRRTPDHDGNGNGHGEPPAKTDRQPRTVPDASNDGAEADGDR